MSFEKTVGGEDSNAVSCDLKTFGQSPNLSATMIRRLLKGQENLLAILSILVGTFIIWKGHDQSDSYWQGVWANLGTGFVGMGIGIYLINGYLDYQARREAVRPLLKLVAPSISGLHNQMLAEAFDVFGMDQFKQLMESYVKNNGNPNALTPDQRDKLHGLVANNKQRHDTTFRKLDDDLVQLTQLIGWSLDSELLKAALEARFSISSFLRIDPSQPESKKQLCEHFLDTTLHAHGVFQKLVEIIGLKDGEVYSDQP